MQWTHEKTQERWLSDMMSTSLVNTYMMGISRWDTCIKEHKYCVNTAVGKGTDWGAHGTHMDITWLWILS